MSLAPADLDMGPPLRTALRADDGISSKLGQWNGEPAIFTRRPVPDNATDPMIIVNPDAALGNADTLNGDRPIVVRDIAIYGTKAAPGDPADQTRVVEWLGFAVRTLFNRKKFSVRPEGYSVIDVIAAGPIPAPVDDEVTVGRLVSLTIRLSRERET